MVSVENGDGADGAVRTGRAKPKPDYRTIHRGTS